MNTSPSTQPNRSGATKMIVGGLAIVVLLAAAGLWWFFRDDAPDDVSLDSAIENLDQGEESGEAATDDDSEAEASATSSSDAGAIAGTWTVDTESGEFDYESATGSFVGFRIEEELRNVGSTTAVGRTGDITGTMVVEGSTVVEASFEIDMTSITTNSSMRDDNVQEAIESGDFPSASFVLTEPIELGDGAARGESVSVEAVGDMTIHGVSNQISFALEAQLVDGVVIAVGSTDITFADYGVQVPDGGPVVSVDDFGILEFQFLLTQTAVSE